MSPGPDPLARLRAICQALPDTHETITWGSPHFRVGEKIFVSFGEGHDGKPGLSVKLTPDHGDALLDDSRFSRAPYVGRFGWIAMDLSGSPDWAQVEALVGESYRLIAPKKSLAKLGGGPASGSKAGREPARKAKPKADGKPTRKRS